MLSASTNHHSQHPHNHLPKQKAPLTLMNLRLHNPLPLPPLLLATDPIPPIPIPHHLAELRKLLVIRKAHHELRLAQRQFIAAVDLPEMVRFAVQADDLLHLFRLGGLPDAGREAVGARHDQHPALDFEDVAVPEAALGGVEGFVEDGADHVFDADEARVGEGGVVDEALADVCAGVGAPLEMW